MNIVVTGATGQLGKTFQSMHRDFPEATFHFCGRERLDITDYTQVETFFDSLVSIDVIINCAAYTAVDQAEQDIDACYEVNEKAVHNLAMIAKKHHALLIHYSTDYVYHSDTGNPLAEQAPTTPKGIYAKSKLAGEQTIKASSCDYFILRTSWVFSEYGHNFLKTMLRLGTERSSLNIVNDQWGAPTYTRDIVKATFSLIHHYVSMNTKNRVLNFCNKDTTHWQAYAAYIFNKKNILCDIHGIPTSDYPTAAERPPWSVLDITNIESLGISTRSWQEAVDECLSYL